MKLDTELLRGVGPLAVMNLLAGGERYAYELLTQLDARTDGVLKLGQGTLYPLLYNLEAKKLVRSRTETVNGRPRRYYRLTPAGRRRLERSRKQWHAATAALAALAT